MNSKPVKALSASFKGLSAVASGSATVIKTGFNGIAKAAQFGIGTLAKISGTAAAGLGLLGKSAMGTYDEITRGNRAMTNSLSDGAKGANEFQGEIKKLGSAGLADMGSLTDIAKNLSSSLNLSGKEAFKMSTNILDIGTAFGMSKDKIENFGLVSSQIFSAGKLMAEDYNQLIDSGAAGPIKKWIAAHNDAGITMDNFKEKVNNGEVSADLYRKAIESLGGDFKGAGQDVQTFGDAFENSMKSLDMSFIESMKKEFGSLGFTLSDMSNNMSDFTTQIGEAAAAFLGGAWQAVSPFVAQLQEGFEGLSFSASDIARIMGVDLFTALGNLIPNMAQVQVFSDLLKGAWDLLMGVLTQITSLINVFVNALMEGAGWLGETGGATEKVKEDFDLLQGVLGTLSAALQPIIQFLGTLVGQLISGAVQLLSWIDKSGLLTSVIQFLGSIIEGVVNVVKALVNGFMEAAGLTDKNSKASKRLSDIVDGLKRIWEMLVPVLSKIAHVIGNVIGVIFNIITAIGSWVANNKVLETALGILLRGIENFVNIASGFLDTNRGSCCCILRGGVASR
jgi:tape measure domain-containing protein